jgi:CheY-like chemotaxis protein
MTARRALVVDDSRSARAFLTRILERYELAVDGVESAEQAIQYLTHQRPDVIFMDHLMPGMDGFQAVQAIKNNPRTATIPIMMYTSQEGELYLSQARALGAIGVLPKQTKHADVSKALEQLRLLGPAEHESDAERASLSTSALQPSPDDARSAAASALAAAPAGSEAAASAPSAVSAAPPPRHILDERRSSSRPALPPIPPEWRALLEAMISHHMLELRRFMVDNLESQSDRIVGDVRLLLHDQSPPPGAAGGAGSAVTAGSAGATPRRAASMGLWWGLIGLLLAALAGLEWQQQRSAAAALAVQLAHSREELASAQQALQSAQAADAATVAAAAVTDSSPSPAANSLLIEPVPFGETPLAGSRLERIQSLLTRLNAQGFHGAVQIRSIPGRYCMFTPATAQPVMAGENVPYARCDQVGNPREDNGSASLRQSVAFANMIATARENSKGALNIELSAGTPDETITPYPPVSEGLLAGDWNRVAAANNRVEVHWQPAH